MWLRTRMFLLVALLFGILYGVITGIGTWMGAGNAVSYIVLAFIFLLFRLFDIAKPFPIRRMDEFESGWGIMLDDLFAGIYARLAVLVVSLVWSGLR